MDVFDSRTLKPMLIFGTEETAFDDPEYLFELKLDGGHGLAYLDDTGTDLFNRRAVRNTAFFPELTSIHKQVNRRCILDGELVVMHDDLPDFESYLQRASLSNPTKIRRAAKKTPITFVAFDVLYVGHEPVMDRTLDQRKALLQELVREDERLALSRFIEQRGTALFTLTSQQGLEGIIAKRRDSLYHPGSRTKEWVKIKNILDDDFIICGYILKAEFVASLVLGQYARSGDLVYKGLVAIAKNREDFAKVRKMPQVPFHPFAVDPPGKSSSAVWIEPKLVCKVRYLSLGANGLMRHPVFTGLRPDKLSKEVHVPAR